MRFPCPNSVALSEVLYCNNFKRAAEVCIYLGSIEVLNYIAQCFEPQPEYSGEVYTVLQRVPPDLVTSGHFLKARKVLQASVTVFGATLNSIPLATTVADVSSKKKLTLKSS